MTVFSDYDRALPTGLAGLALLDESTHADWRNQALCAEIDPDAFFPNGGAMPREALKVCACCVVRAECLDDAVEHNEHFGIWGGLTSSQRRKLKASADSPAKAPAA